MTNPHYTPALQSAIARSPKTELHLHIEGSLEPELMFALAQRNGVALPYPSEATLRAAYDFADLQSFLDLYYAGAAVLLHEQDFYDLTWAWVLKAHSDNVVHAELFFDPQTHTVRGVDIGVVIGGISRALAAAEQQFGMTSALILCFLRHLPEADAFETLEAALPYRQHFIGVGLDSGERGNPPANFARVFARARELGLRAVAHAGEEGPAAYVQSALDDLHAERVDHGVRSVESPELVARLAREAVPLTVCPLSNTRLQVFKRMQDHTLPQLLAAGCKVCINADDPAYFGGYLNDNWHALFEALPLTANDAWRMTRNGVEASFALPARKQELLHSVDDYWSQHLRK